MLEPYPAQSVLDLYADNFPFPKCRDIPTKESQAKNLIKKQV
jgi:hypothetical protein